VEQGGGKQKEPGKEDEGRDFPAGAGMNEGQKQRTCHGYFSPRTSAKYKWKDAQVSHTFPFSGNARAQTQWMLCLACAGLLVFLGAGPVDVFRSTAKRSAKTFD
jgi:hypothetical protein